MNILSVHNQYLVRGGEDESTELENSLLREKGHAVFEYLADNQAIEGKLLVTIGLRSVWNPTSHSNIRRLIQEHRIDLVKVDNFFPQISPAVYYAAGAERIPVVQTLRNYRLLCPNSTMFRNGRICEKCVGRSVAWPALLHGCYRNSRTQTLAPVAMASIHRLAGTWRRRVTAYVALSAFSRQKFVRSGLPAEKIFVKPNFVQDRGVGSGEGQYAIFVGRLSAEKGLDVLLSAWARVGQRLPLKIVGVGPLEDKVRELAAVNPAVEYLGKKPLAEAYELMGRAMVLIFPSNSYETFGRTVIEAFAKGTPVIASSLGHITKMVTHRRNGLHFTAGSSESLLEQVEWMLAHQAEWKEARRAARRAYEESFTPGQNYLRMMQIYDKAAALKQQELLNHKAVNRPYWNQEWL